MKSKTKPKKFNLKSYLTKHTIILVAIGIIAICGIGYFAFAQQTSNEQALNVSDVSPTEAPSTAFPTLIPTPTVDLSLLGQYKTYTNSKYGFQITYPAIGPGRGKIIECGNAIGPDNMGDPSDSDIDLDGFFVIHIGPREKSLNDYIHYRVTNGTLTYQNMHYDLNSLYTLENITTANADEAIAFRTNPQNTAHIGYDDGAPFAFTIAMYRKNSVIVELLRRQDGGAGCASYAFTEMSTKASASNLFSSPKDFDYYVNSVYPTYRNWDAAKSFKFL